MDQTDYAEWQRLQKARARVQEQIRRSSGAAQSRGRPAAARQSRPAQTAASESHRQHRAPRPVQQSSGVRRTRPQTARTQTDAYSARSAPRPAGAGRPVSGGAYRPQQTRPGAKVSQPAAGTPRGRNGALWTDNSDSYASTREEYEYQRLLEEKRKQELAREQERKEAYRRQTIEVFKWRAALCLIFFVIFAAIVAAIFFFTFNHTKKNTLPAEMKYTVGGETVATLPQTEAYSEKGTLYADFTEIADFLSMAAVGDASEMRYLFLADDTASAAGSGNEEYVIFRAGSPDAVINGQPVALTDAAKVNEAGHWLVPADFVTTYMQNLTLSVKGSRVSVDRIEANPGRAKGEEVKYYPVSFTLKSIGTLKNIPEEDYTSLGGSETFKTPEGTYELNFKADLSAYEAYMDPADRDGYLVLINNEHTVDATYAPTDLVDVVNTRKDGRATQKMRETAAKALEALYIEMEANGYKDVSVTSAYRTYEYQSSLFNSYTAQEMKANPKLTLAQAQEITATYSARPGTSEHQSGLCCDMHNLSAADVSFAKKDAYKWLTENAWKFGFILRFPEDKVGVTQISFEPWHYRFVGRYHAKAIHDAGLCLEEYLLTIR